MSPPDFVNEQIHSARKQSKSKFGELQNKSNGLELTVYHMHLIVTRRNMDTDHSQSQIPLLLAVGGAFRDYAQTGGHCTTRRLRNCNLSTVK